MVKGIIIVVGGGFAGLTALKALMPLKKEYEIVLIDKRETSDFLPCLPDIVGRGVNPDNLVMDLKSFCRQKGLTFVNQEVIHIDIENHQLKTPQKLYSYDYLIAAPGAQTNFYGNDALAGASFTLTSVASVQSILDTVKERGREIEHFIVAGGGYTGIEIATNLWRYFKRQKEMKKIVIAEKASAILGTLPGWMKEYTATNLKRMGIEVLLNSGIQDFRDGEIVLSPQQRYPKAVLIWTAGVKTPAVIQDLPCSKGPQGRITVDPYLRVDEKTFVLGDCAFFDHEEGPLRMAIQFSIAEGRLAAQNIIRSIKKRQLKIYKPVDLGYVIPMANNRSCGRVLGVNMKGVIPTFLHYFMCVYRSWSWRNRVGLMRGLFRPPVE